LVQKGGTVHPTAGRWERRIRSHLGGREGWSGSLNEGQTIGYEEVSNRGKTSA
jgi:hypothetical protein